MKVHHLNCATLCPYGGPLVSGSWSVPAKMVAHCLLVETHDGLVLIDTGLGLQDVQVSGNLSKAFMTFVRPALRFEETAIEQVRALGFSPQDVRHIIPTHLDVDHTGGIPDFPDAKVHIFEPEYQAAMAPPSWLERERYWTKHWPAESQWVRYQRQGEPWFGFEAVRALEGLPPEILLVPLTGHTRGHVGVAVQSPNGWLLHAGDAYFHRDEMSLDRPSCPAGFDLFQSIVQVDRKARLHNQGRLRALKRAQSEVRIFSAHDPHEFTNLVG